MTDKTPITLVSTTDISDMLNPTPPGRRMPMKGFDDEFVDIADYIIRITDRIWHERKVELCQAYYSKDSIIHTMAGDIVGAATVEANTHATLKSFPDRTLDGDNVIWSGNEDDGYYSSHLITSRMTNDGPSEFGPPTGKRARIRTIADCLCIENKVVEEWLARDNAALVQQLGLDVVEVAQKQAKEDRDRGKNLIDILAERREHALSGSAPQSSAHWPAPETDPGAFAEKHAQSIWNEDLTEHLSQAYDFRVSAHMTAGRDLYGTLEYGEYLSAFKTAVPDAKIAVEHVADVPYLGDARDIAVRWSLAGHHRGDGLFGPASGAPIYILGITQWRTMNGRIREEWTVFDELAVQRQIETARLG